MNTKELRLGNLVVYNGSVFKITGILKDRVTADRGKGDVEFGINEITPLKITEYWLLKFGFKRYPWGLVINEILFKDKDHKCEELTLEVGNGFRTEIKFVHHLQNLYPALSGKELQFLEK